MIAKEFAARSHRRPAAQNDAENVVSTHSVPRAVGDKLTTNYESEARALLARGHLIIPILPGQKRPAMAHWETARLSVRDLPRFTKAGVGVLCGQGAHPLVGLDIDTANAELAEHMVRWCSDNLGLTCERVGKPPKILLVYRAAEPGWNKITGAWYRDAAGTRQRYEILGHGQQFVAYHVHPDTQAPYEWVDLLGGLTEVNATDLPIVTRAQLDAFGREFDAAAARFGLERETSAARAAPERETLAVVGEFLPADDDDGLDAIDRLPLGLPPDELRDHAMRLAAAGCWDGYDAWLEAGMVLHHEFSGALEGFEIWHEASTCAAKYESRDDCLAKWRSFRVEPANGKRPRTARSLVKASNRLSRADLVLDAKGKPIPHVRNMIRVVEDPKRCGMHFEFDEFLGVVMVRTNGADTRRPIRDEDYVDVLIALEKHSLPRVGADLCRAIVSRVAHDRTTDCLVEWIESLKHDGVPRVATLMQRYFHAPAGEYVEAVANYLVSGLAARAVDPGHKADMAVVLIGRQGAGKSKGVAALAPVPDFFGEITFDRKEDDIARELQGKVVIELSELAGLSNKDVEHVKSFLSRGIDEWIPKFKEHPVRRPRRCIFVATTNEPRFLADSTGHRRWLPVEVGDVDVEGLLRDRDQLWAEGLQLFRRHGVMWQDAERLARDVHDRHVVVDAWESVIAAWLAQGDDVADGPPVPRTIVRVAEILDRALSLPRGQMTAAAARRVAGILRGLGWREDRKRIDGARERVWVPA